MTPVPTWTVLENVVTPATLTLSKFVWPSTSISPDISNSVAVMIPSWVPPVLLKLTPMPGTLKWLILALPRVISLDTVAELAVVFDPITILLLPVVTLLPE